MLSMLRRWYRQPRPAGVPRWLDQYLARLVAGLVQGAREHVGDSRAAVPMSIRDAGPCFRIEADVSNLTRDDLSVTIRGTRLTICGTCATDPCPPAEDAALPRSGSELCRTFALPPDVDRDRISARLVEDVLVIDLPKEDGRRQREVPVL